MPGRPLCILLPGFDGSGRLFAPLLAETPLPFEPRVVALPSDVPRGYDELLTWMTDQLPADRPFALLAESFSGPLAIRIASRRPKLLTHVILGATFLRSPLRPWLAALGRFASAALFLRPPPDLAVRTLLAGRDADPSLVAGLRDAMSRVPARVAAARARSALTADEGDAFARMTARTLWIQATADRLLRPCHAGEARALRPEIEVVSIEAPHLLFQRRPRECLAAIDRFLGSGRASRS